MWQSNINHNSCVTEEREGRRRRKQRTEKEVKGRESLNPVINKQLTNQIMSRDESMECGWTGREGCVWTVNEVVHGPDQISVPLKGTKLSYDF